MPAHVPNCKRCGSPDLVKGRSYCRPCRNARAQETYHQDPEYRARVLALAAKRHAEGRSERQAYLRRRKYGMEPEAYDALLEAQDGRCAICLRVFGTERYWDRAHVDHDHLTGAVRGLLCPACNTALGHLRDSIPNLERAVAYLAGP